MKVWSWRQAILRAQLEPSSKLLLLALSTYMNDHGEGCYPSIEQLCKDTSLSERTVFYHLKKAEAEGFLIKDKRELPGKKWAANEYRAAIPESPIGAIVAVDNPEVHSLHLSERDATDAPHDAEWDATIAVKGCNDCSDGVQPLHTNSPKNSPLNSPIEISLKGKKSYPQEFEQFWTTWPAARRCEKPNAYTAWCEACRKTPADELITALQRYVLSKEAMDGFAPYPTKWLKRERWLELSPMPDFSPPAIQDIASKTQESAEWLAILQHLRSKHGDAVCRSWFSQLRLVDKQDGQLVLHAPTRFVAEWIRSHYIADIAQAAQNVWPEIFDIRIDSMAAVSENRKFPTENIASATPALSNSGQQ
jgi:hypothetical protein